MAYPASGSGFLVAILKKAEGRTGQSPEGFFRNATGVTPGFRFSSALHEVVGVAGPETTLVRDPRTGRAFLLHGEILDGEPSSGNHLLEAYGAGGATGLGSLDGSFALLAWDSPADRVSVVTDRWNSRRVFHSREDEAHWFSTARTLERHPRHSGTLDPGGVAHFLVNQLPYNGRTLNRDIRVLGGASVHTVEPEGWSGRPYWRLEITDDHAGRSDGQLRDGFHERLIQAVEKRGGGAASPWLALTGGWDSRSILGAAHESGLAGLRCFSYGETAHGPESDVAVAQAVAEALGYPHHFAPGYDSDLFQVLETNQVARGTIQLVVETDAWSEVGNLLTGSDPPPPVLFGDQGAGCPGDPFIGSTRDALDSLKIQGMDAVPWLRPLMPAASYRLMHEALAADRAEIAARVPAGLAPQDLRYWLYMDQNRPRRIGYREYFTASSGQPRYPLLDHRLMEYVAGVPTRARVDRSLLKATAAERFPEVFATDGATDSGPPAVKWFQRELQRHEVGIRRTIREQPSALDELLPPEVLLSVLDGALDRRWERGWGRVRKRLRRDLGHGRAGRWIGRRLHLAGSSRVSPGRFLVCALHIRSLLGPQGASFPSPAPGNALR